MDSRDRVNNFEQINASCAQRPVHNRVPQDGRPHSVLPHDSPADSETEDLAFVRTSIPIKLRRPDMTPLASPINHTMAGWTSRNSLTETEGRLRSFQRRPGREFCLSWAQMAETGSRPLRIAAVLLCISAPAGGANLFQSRNLEQRRCDLGRRGGHPGLDPSLLEKSALP